MLRWHSCLNGRERASLLDVRTSPGYGGGGSHVQRHVRRIGEETAPGAAFQPARKSAEGPKGPNAEGDGGVAQLGEHLPCTQGVSGSRRSKLRSTPNPLSALRVGDSSQRSVAPPLHCKAVLCSEMPGKSSVGSFAWEVLRRKRWSSFLWT